MQHVLEQLEAGAGDEAVGEAARRRTFAVISHPDAGKSTLTEALALHARAITQAGHVHGKAGRNTTVSDWMEMEQARGISISSAVLQLTYRDTVLNLVDTPGHADFSEDTYRVLTAVDAAIMLVDASKGLEVQTMKLFAVCKHRGIPIITVINKWDRPGKDPLELMDEITERPGLTPTPLTWPVGIAGDFRGVVERDSGDYVAFTPTAGGAQIAPEERLGSEEAAAREGEAWTVAQEESQLLAASGAEHDQEMFLGGISTPVLFAAAVRNFGVRRLLDALVELAPAPGPRPDREGQQEKPGTMKRLWRMARRARRGWLESIRYSRSVMRMYTPLSPPEYLRSWEAKARSREEEWRRDKDAFERDGRALYDDWKMVAQDLDCAMRTYGRECREASKAMRSDAANSRRVNARNRKPRAALRGLRPV